jgi:hypothetical protein
VLTLKFAMEYGGLVACLDDLYVQPAWRNKGLSTAALLEVRTSSTASRIASSLVASKSQARFWPKQINWSACFLLDMIRISKATNHQDYGGVGAGPAPCQGCNRHEALKPRCAFIVYPTALSG